MQRIICLDLEGVILPEMWKHVAEHTGVPALGLTTRDIADYNELMSIRIAALHEHKIRLKTIQEIIVDVEPLPGAVDFLAGLRKNCETIIVSDTFTEFFHPFRERLGFPVIFCNSLDVDGDGYIQKHLLRQEDGKRHVVLALQKCNFFVVASGDSYNDLAMIEAAQYGALFLPPESITRTHSHIPVFKDYPTLQEALLNEGNPR